MDQNCQARLGDLEFDIDAGIDGMRPRQCRCVVEHLFGGDGFTGFLARPRKVQETLGDILAPLDFPLDRHQALGELVGGVLATAIELVKIPLQQLRIAGNDR